MSTLGERLRKARERKGYSQTEVFRRTKINNKTLSRYEIGGSEPDVETLKVLAELYEASLSWLLTGKETNITNDQAKNAVIEIYTRLPQEKKRIIDEMIKALDEK